MPRSVEQMNRIPPGHITAHNVKAIVRFKEIMVGNGNLMLDYNIAIPSEDMPAGTEVMAHIRVPMSIDEELLGKTIWVYSSSDAENDPMRR